MPPAPASPVQRLDTRRRVELAEGVEIDLPIAGPFPRCLAMGLDVVLVLVGGALIGMAASGLGTLLGGPGIGQGLYLLSNFFTFWGYFAFFEAGRRGATPGKRMQGLRVVQTSGEPVTLAQALVRSFLFFLEGWITCGSIGLAVMAGNSRFQRLGDLAAGTVVVYTDKALKPPQLATPPAPLHEPQSLPLRLSREEQRALMTFAERAPAWSQERQAELAGLVSRLSGGRDPRAAARLLRQARWLRQS